MASIYDTYQLANSNQVKQFQGSTLPEMIKVADVLQQRYDASDLGMEGLGSMIKGAKVLGKDQELFNQRSGEYSNQINEWTKRPDLENVTKDVAKAGRQFANEYKEFATNLARAQEYQKELDDQVEKEIISRERANLLLARSNAEYSGMQYDSASGKYTGRFSGIGAAREVDVTEKIKKAVGDIAPDATDVTRSSVNGDYIFKTRNGIKSVSAKEIQQRLAAAYAVDGEWQADVNQRVDLNTWAKTKNIRESDLSADFTAAARKSGVDPVAAYKASIAKKEQDSILTNIGIIADKYAFSDTTDEKTISGLSVDGQKRSNQLDEPAFLIPSPDFRLSEKDKDIPTLQEGIGKANADIETIQQRISKGGLHPDEVRDLRNQLLAAQSNKTAKQAILDGARDEAARSMGYANYGDYIDKSSTPAKLLTKFNEVAKKYNYEDGIVMVGDDGKRTTVTKGAIVQAMRTGNINVGSEFGMPSATVTIGGKTFKTDNTIASKALVDFTESVNKDINAKTREFVKTNAEKYAVKVVETPLTKAESASLKQTIRTNMTAYNFYKPGQSDPISDSDKPADIDMGSIKILKDNGKVFLTAAGLDDKGKATGQSYNIEVTPGSNIGTVIGKRMLMDNGNPKKINQDKDMRAAASVLTGGNMSGTLMSLQNNEKIPITTSGGRVMGYVERKAYSTSPGSDSRYLVYDEDGKTEISEGIPESLRRDPAKLATWIEEAQLQEELKEAKKKQ